MLKRYSFPLELRILLLLIIMSLNSYPLILAGWTSTRAYATLGAIRGVAQMISYEISFAILLIRILLLFNTSSLMLISSQNFSCGLIFLISPILILLLLSSVAERNRTPFDFAEGESELVSGFNVEYRAGPFAIIFMAEYGSILFLRILISLFFSFLKLGGGAELICFLFAFL